MQRKLSCPNCFAETEAANINLEKLIAKCGQCNTVFHFAEPEKQHGRQRPELLLPPGIQAYTTPNEVDLLLSWRRSRSSFLTFFAIFWNAMLIPFVITAIASGELTTLVGISLHLLIGVGLTYYMLAVFFNTTHINVDHYNLLIEHRPLRIPFYKDHDISITEVKQLFVHKYTNGQTNGKPNYAYAVNAILPNKRTLKLVQGIKHPDQALYIEQQIERFLEIKDEVVEEEWKGG